jgi:NADH:ubiquinone oxidoreductase subunit 5 (subunit L)/multisubunit Na+/H+ antiporter MnhA subunit
MSDIIFWELVSTCSFCLVLFEHNALGSPAPTPHVPKTQQPANLAYLFDTSSRQKNTRMAQTIRAIKNPAEAGCGV